MSKISVDKDKCIGCGACTMIANDTFEIEDDGLAGAIKNDITDDVIEAQEGCPTDAIDIEK